MTFVSWMSTLFWVCVLVGMVLVAGIFDDRYWWKVIFLPLSPSLRMILVVTVLVLAATLVLEQVIYRRKKNHLPGPPFVWPILGNSVTMTIDPFDFWRDQRHYGDLSCNSITQRFLVYVASPQICQQLLNDHFSDSFRTLLHPNGEYFLGSNSLFSLQGAEHERLRTLLLPLFTRSEAVLLSISAQEPIIRDHLALWSTHYQTKATEIRLKLVALNLEIFQTVFLGPYLDEQQRVKFGEEFLSIHEGILSLPLPIPGMVLHRAIQGKTQLMSVLKRCVAESKQYMTKDSDPRCLLDLFWWQTQGNDSNHTVSEETKSVEEVDMAAALFDFLFASQDLSASSLVWCMILLEEQPEVQKKIVEEQTRLRPNDDELNLETLSMMKFTRNFVYEVLRYRPPAAFIPREALKDVSITPDVVVPKGSIVVSSLWSSVPENFPNVTQLGANHYQSILKDESFLVFGKGSHSCLGKQYAVNLMVTFLAILCSNCTWKRHTTGRSKELVLLPALYPADCLLSFQSLKKES